MRKVLVLFGLRLLRSVVKLDGAQSALWDEFVALVSSL